jgi:hypothetical protein
MKKVVILIKNGFACYFDNIPINHPFIKGDDDGLKTGGK